MSTSLPAQNPGPESRNRAFAGGRGQVRLAASGARSELPPSLSYTIGCEIPSL
jgi:hypothetical protein